MEHIIILQREAQDQQIKNDQEDQRKNEIIQSLKV